MIQDIHNVLKSNTQGKNSAYSYTICKQKVLSKYTINGSSNPFSLGRTKPETHFVSSFPVPLILVSTQSFQKIHDRYKSKKNKFATHELNFITPSRERTGFDTKFAHYENNPRRAGMLKFLNSEKKIFKRNFKHPSGSRFGRVKMENVGEYADKSLKSNPDGLSAGPPEIYMEIGIIFTFAIILSIYILLWLLAHFIIRVSGNTSETGIYVFGTTSTSGEIQNETRGEIDERNRVYNLLRANNKILELLPLIEFYRCEKYKVEKPNFEEPSVNVVDCNATSIEIQPIDVISIKTPVLVTTLKVLDKNDKVIISKANNKKNGLENKKTLKEKTKTKKEEEKEDEDKSDDETAEFCFFDNCNTYVAKLSDPYNRLLRQVTKKIIGLTRKCTSYSFIDDKTCSICLESFVAPPKDDFGNLSRLLPCGHAFHQNCIDPWIIQQMQSDTDRCCCPICKQKVFKNMVTILECIALDKSFVIDRGMQGTDIFETIEVNSFGKRYKEFIQNKKEKIKTYFILIKRPTRNIYNVLGVLKSKIISVSRAFASVVKLLTFKVIAFLKYHLGTRVKNGIIRIGTRMKSTVLHKRISTTDLPALGATLSQQDLYSSAVIRVNSLSAERNEVADAQKIVFGRQLEANSSVNEKSNLVTYFTSEDIRIAPRSVGPIEINVFPVTGTINNAQITKKIKRNPRAVAEITIDLKEIAAKFKPRQNI
ncbi:Protein goliath [Zancudomyces culisetae]|uniref:RING-type E3 ubiquitin transferase n=1 Tax=Zancudomyces culisetae TaxID=1213189 RepID=A0A1R1PHD7_ZANCU|nr:Protein goliath [Zancudomyces culisetae]|eukprot:OMH80390.1 Protein goliath [Zancudomyces culisetae]